MAVLIGVVAVVLAINVWLVVWVNVSEWRRARRRRINPHRPVAVPRSASSPQPIGAAQIVSSSPQGGRSPIGLS